MSLLIVDDHQMVADGLARALGQDGDIEVVGTAGSMAELLDLAARLRPQVALVDFRLPDGTGAEAARALRDVTPDTAVVIVTAFATPEVVAEVIDAGCIAFLNKDENLHNLRRAVVGAAAGESVFAQELLVGLVDRLRRPAASSRWDLTGREMEVLRGLARGHSTERIAADLYVSRNTVRNHTQNLLMKLGAHSKLEAVVIGVREGLVSMEQHPG